MFEAANLLNERPIGRHPTSPDEGTYICPNDPLLGRCTSIVPSGPLGSSRKYPYPYHGWHRNFTRLPMHSEIPKCSTPPPHAFGIPDSFTPLSFRIPEVFSTPSEFPIQSTNLPRNLFFSLLKNVVYIKP